MQTISGRTAVRLRPCGNAPAARPLPSMRPCSSRGMIVRPRIAQPMQSPSASADLALLPGGLLNGLTGSGSGSGSADAAASSSRPSFSHAAAVPLSAPQQHLSTAAAAAPASSAAAVGAQKGPSDLTKRVSFGLLLGVAGAAIIGHGKLPFLAAVMFVVYHATQEYFGMITGNSVARGAEPPSVVVTAATTLLCMAIAPLVYFTRVKSGTAMCVAAFLLLALHVVADRRPTFSQLTSSVFGLFYCGELVVLAFLA